MCSLGIEPTTFCAANTMLYHWATGTILSTQISATSPDPDNRYSHPSNNNKACNPVQIFKKEERKKERKKKERKKERKKEERKKSSVRFCQLIFRSAPLFTEINPNQIKRSAAEYLNLSICYTNSSSIKLPTPSVINECVECDVLTDTLRTEIHLLHVGCTQRSSFCGLMLHTFKIKLLSYKQVYRKQPPGLHAHFTKRSSRQNCIFFIVYSLQFILNFFLVSAFCETKVLGRMSNLGNGKGTKKYHKSSPCNPCAIFQVFWNHTRVYATPLCSSAQIENTFKGPIYNIYILWLSLWNICILWSNIILHFILKYE